MDKEKYGLLVDFANSANEDIGRFQRDFTLSPSNLGFDDFLVESLNWKSIEFGEKAQLDAVPDDTRGVYAFVICVPNSVLPPHGYVLYVGIAGRKSKRSLRKRYGDYLNPKKVHKERPTLAYAFGNWGEVIRFYFAPIDEDMSSDDLEKLEIQINTALMPPYSRGDIEAETRKKQKAFQ